jgi:hypothetical protein
VPDRPRSDLGTGRSRPGRRRPGALPSRSRLTADRCRLT